MFLGQSNNLLDEKFRLVLPARYREELGYKFYVARDFDPCLLLYPPGVYAVKAERMSNLDDFSPEGRAVKREFFGHSFLASMDKQGRIQLPRVLLDKLGITKEVVVVGMQDHLEVWDLATYRAHEEKTESCYSDLACKLVGKSDGQ